MTEGYDRRTVPLSYSQKQKGCRIINAQTIGEKISALRKSRNMTQQQLADEIHVTNKAVSKWESGTGMPDITILPALASVLGVTVDDIMSNDGLSVKRAFFTRRLSARLRSKKAKIIVCAIAAALILTFGIINLLWFRYIDHVFTPFLQNEKLTSFSIKENRWTLYQYNDLDNGYVIQLIKPPYLKYGGSISIRSMAEPVTDFTLSDFTITHTSYMGRIQQGYELGLGGMWFGRSHTVDRFGHQLAQHPEDYGEYYERWLLMFEEHYNEIMAMISYFYDFFI